jgi:hypothetical protein
MSANFAPLEMRRGLSSTGRSLALAALFVAVLCPLLIWLVGSRNPFTPAGYVGYLTRGAVFGRSTFYGVQHGPTSPGRSWLAVTNVSITPYTYSEDFTADNAVLSKDNLKMNTCTSCSGCG